MQWMASCRNEESEGTGKKMSWKDVRRTWMAILLLASAVRKLQAQGLCEPDKFGNCPMLAKEGKCVTGIDDYRPAAWVVQRCPLSCQENACMNPCVDKDPQCSRKAAAGECFSAPTFMIENCRKTCQIYPCKLRNKPFAADDRLAGHATDIDTKKFATDFQRNEEAADSFYRRDPSLGSCIVPHQKVRSTPWLHLSSVGLGIEGGRTNELADFAMEQATGTAILRGINVIDTSIVARDQRSEMSIGQVLRTLLLLNISRSSLFISSKAGFIPGNPFHDGLVKWSEQLRRKKLDPAAFVGNYCIAPQCLQKSLEQSLSNLGISTLDVLFLHTPAEAMLGAIARTDFFSRIKRAFLFLEEKRKQGLIQTYGISVTDCLFRHPQDPLHLQLQDLVNIADSAGGSNHGFRYVQIPVGAGLPSLWAALHQRIDGINETTFTAPEAAARLRLGVLGTDPRIQGGLLYNATIFQTMKEFNPLIVDESSYAKELTNFARSIPYITSSLIGVVDLPAITKQLELVEEAGWSTKLLGLVQNRLEHALQ
mmetsp:Transcript_9725/g.59032  ORF Transcript_9725/g.59032 Transcript_9725/m.59032 type:complete len:538 (-) Transcript_9725:352-1965(-)